MSRAFVRESDSEQLRDVAPNMASLLLFLKREYGMAVYELKTRFSEKYQREVHELSDGLGYMLNDEVQWREVMD